ncbi:MAG: potassium channel family protein [Candidatus Peribacteraceae bacterium]|nr:potassium channel family protein [Candidatus Peribacteraceae bacterium]
MEDIKEIWQQTPEAFNDWRRKNDIPLLIGFFKEVLPHFEEWQTQFSVTDELILKSNQTSEFFIGSGLHTFYSYFNPWHWNEGAEICASPEKDFEGRKEWADRSNKSITGDRKKFEYTVFTSFIPYFHWLKTEKNINKFRVKRDGSDVHADDFVYSHWSGTPQVSYASKIFGRHAVVNLASGLEILGHLIRGKNLDFANLDALTITGRRMGGTTFSKIRYSSFRDLMLKNLDMPFIELERCHISNMNIVNCQIQDLHFICNHNASISRIYNSRLTHLEFDNCTPIRTSTDLNRADMPDFKFTNHKSLKHDDKRNFYSKMRRAAQEFGYSYQAQENYYLERKYQMLFQTSLQNTRECYDLCDHEAILIFKRNGLRIDKHIRYFWRRIRRELRAYAKREGVFTAHISARFKALVQWLDFLIWGFGERPWRIVLCGFINILFFAGIYSHFYFKNNFYEAITHSVYVFTTIGYGSLTDASNLQYVIAIQALSGVVLLGLFLSSLVNKVRY